jgi:zinc protease
MVFKGTRSHGVGGVAHAIEAMGGDLNAFTSFDDTAFHCTVPASRAPEALAVLAEMLCAPLLDADELERERLVVLEEIRGGEDDPDLVLAEATWARAFPGHPYGRPVIGTVQTVSAIGRDALAAFWERWYHPANAVLSVAGPVDVEAVLAVARDSLGGPARSVPDARREAQPPTHVAPSVIRRGFEATLVELSWPCGAVDIAREAVLDVLCGALGGGRSAPLEARLRRREGLVQSVSVGTATERDGGLISVTLHAHAGQAGAAVAATREELSRAADGGLSEADVARARAGIVAGLATRRESVDARASDLAGDVVKYADPQAWRAYLRHVEAVTHADVTAAARALFRPDAEVLVALVADDDTFEIPAPRERASPRAPARGEASREPSRHVLPNGVRVLLEPTASEVVAVRVAGLGGARAVAPSAAGRGSAWARMLTRGVQGLDAHAFACEVEALGAGMGATTGRAAQVVRGDFVRGNWAEAMGLLGDMLRVPSFDRDELERVRTEMLAALDERDDEPEQVATERLAARLYPGHPYGAPAGGTRASLGRLTPAGLSAYHAAWARADNLVVAVSGGFDPDVMLRRLGRCFAWLPPGRAVFRPAVVRAPASVERVRVRTDREQAHVIAVWPGARAWSDAQPVVEIATGVLGGQGGRLFMRLREQHGLAYQVGVQGNEGWDTGIVVGTVSTDPARIDEAERRLVDEVGGLGAAPLEDGELERARAAALGALDAELQAAGARATLMALAELHRGEGVDAVRGVRARLARVGHEDVRAWATRALGRPWGIARVEVTS